MCSSRGTCTFVELPRASLARRLNSLFVVLVAFFLIRKCLLEIRLHVHVSSLVYGFHKVGGHHRHKVRAAEPFQFGPGRGLIEGQYHMSGIAFFRSEMKAWRSASTDGLMGGGW